jgi:hypothetical protein
VDLRGRFTSGILPKWARRSKSLRRSAAGFTCAKHHRTKRDFQEARFIPWGRRAELASGRDSRLTARLAGGGNATTGGSPVISLGLAAALHLGGWSLPAGADGTLKQNVSW